MMPAVAKPSPGTRAAATQTSVIGLPPTRPVATPPTGTKPVATIRVATEPVATQSIKAQSAPLSPRDRSPRLHRPQTLGGLPKKARTAAWRTLAIGVLALGVPATALGAGAGPPQPTTSTSAQSSGARTGAARGLFEHPVLAFGSGYSSPGGSPLVRLLQRDLGARGYPTGPIDGLYGPRTREAVVAFQAARGLQVDGVVGPRTWAALSEPALILGPGAGDQPGGGSVVRSLQRRLAAAGDSPGPIDGRYGVLTEGAVRRFQRAHGLPVTGIVGPRTLALLAKPEASVRRSNPLRQRSAPSAKRSNGNPRPTGFTATGAPRKRPASAAREVPRGSAHRPGSGSVPWTIIVGVLALALVLALVARLLILCAAAWALAPRWPVSPRGDGGQRREIGDA